MLSNKIYLSLAALSAACLSSCAWNDPCKFPELADDIKRTRDYVKYAAPLGENYGVLMGPIQRVCAVVSFDISSEGIAENMKLEAWHPNIRSERTAYTTLSRYRSKVPKNNTSEAGKERYFLYFEESKEMRDKLRSSTSNVKQP